MFEEEMEEESEDGLNISKISMTKRGLKKICRKWDTRMVEVVKRKVRRMRMTKMKMNQLIIEAMMESAADEDDEDEDESIDD